MRPVEFPHFPPHGGPVFSLIFSALQNYKTPFPSPFPSLIRFTRWMTKKGGIKEEWKRRVEEETTYLRVQPSYPANSALSLTPRRRFNLWFNASKKEEGKKRKDLRGCPVFRIEGWRFFTNFLSLLMLAARVAQGIENVDVSKEREWPVSRATKAPPPPLWSLPSFQPFSLSLSFSLYSPHSRLYPRSHTSLCRAISFARFAPTKSRKLWEGMREGEGKFFARKPRPDSPLPGPRETSRLRWWCSYTVATFGGGKEREYIYILHII